MPQGNFVNWGLYMKHSPVVIFIPPAGFNETGFGALTAALKNAGIGYCVLSLTSTLACGNNGKKVKPDLLLSNCKPSNFSGLIITGGTGVLPYKGHSGIAALVSAFSDAGKLLAGICTGPLLLAPAINKNAAEYTCHETVKNELKQTAGRFNDIGIVTHGRIITAAGEQFAGPFADRIISAILNNRQ